MTAFMPTPKQQYFGIASIPLIGGKIFTYAAGGSVPKATFTDAAGTTAQPNPIVLNARGEPPNAIFWNGSYRVVIQDALGNLIYSVDNYQTPLMPGDLTVNGGAGLIGFDSAANYQAGSIGKFLTDLAKSVGSTFIGFVQAGVGAVVRTLQAELRERISISQFGAVLDGVTDDSAALQKAINYCATFSRWPALVIPGRCRLAASVNIDRLVDTTTGKFRIIGQGPGAGFYVDSAITMFDSTLPTTADPQTERVRFEGILFEASDATLASYVLSQKYLRMEFDNCEFQKIRMVNATIYLQDYWLTDCRIKDNGVSFMNCNGLYNVNFIGGSIKFGNTLVNNVSTAIGTNGLHFSGGFLAEGVKTQMVRANGATLSVIGCHFEANKLPMFNLFVGGPDNNSVTFVANYDYNPDSATAGTLYYGATNSVFSSGNTSFPNVMHAHISSVLNFVSAGDSTPNLVDDMTQLTNTMGGLRTNGDAARLNRLITSNDVGIGSDVVATVRAYIKGKGTTAATFSCVIANSAGGDIAQFKDDKSTKLFGPFGCNGATPQGPATSGGTLSGVIAALVANGTLSS